VHEVRQPLNVIMLACRVIKLKTEQSSLPADVSSVLVQRSDLIASQVRRATDIVKGLSEFNKGLGSDQGETDVAAVFHKVHDLMEQQFSTRQITLEWDSGNVSLLVTVPERIVEGIVVQGLAFGRDTVQAISDWHKGQNSLYFPRVNVTLNDENGLITLFLAWETGQLPRGTYLIDPQTHPGLLVTSSILASNGGSLQTAQDSLRITFSGSR
jgi:nitrogen fixation/metabolism regulation signal transduction histidine kinase